MAAAKQQQKKGRERKILKEKELNDKLRSVYYNKFNSAFVSSPKNVTRNVQNVSNSDVKKWLLTQDAHTLHRAQSQTYRTNHYLVFRPYELFELDLIDLQGIARFNYGYKYILCVVDCFSKFLWAVPLTNKTTAKTTAAFKSILESNNNITPVAVNFDRGGEFNSNEFKAFCKKMGIQVNFPYIQSYNKAAIIERTIRTLKERIFKYFTAQGPNYHKYIDVLPNLVEAYNNTVHSTTKMAPAAVQPQHTVQVYKNIRQAAAKRDADTRPTVKFKIGDYVRLIRKKKSALEHGYLQRWSKEIYRIHRIIYKIPIPLYEIIDLKDKIISGKFYQAQLLKVIIPSHLAVKIINTRATRRNTIHEVLTGDGSVVYMTQDQYDANNILNRKNNIKNVA